ncbi:ATP-binding protein [Vallitalea okinawensis]|uniref:ATP-binding protein n=1 Tax=Vallitalea okinawensis TaxID=2078660 RepID=UPI000CFB0ABE|nr:AAA family ATPase [Vallitalea okinawensis]
MIIKTLRLKSFGKYKEKNIDLKPGINLIYGENESGKTTLQRFIKGIFFGFYKPYIKKRSYTSDYEQYKPWNADSYKGSIIIEESKPYRIERDFSKYHEEIKVMDMSTGEDITGQCVYDKRTKAYLPLSLVGDISEHYFKNILNIQQLHLKPEKKFSEELKDYYQSLNQTDASDMSINGVIQALESKVHDLGSETRKKSPIGQITEQINQLKLERHRWFEKKELNNELTERIQELQIKELDIHKTISEQQYHRSEQQKVINEEKEAKILRIQREIENLEEKLDTYKYYEHLSEKSLNQAYELYKESKALKKEREDLKVLKDKTMIQESSITEKKANRAPLMIGIVPLCVCIWSMYLALMGQTIYYIFSVICGFLTIGSVLLYKRSSTNKHVGDQQKAIMGIRQRILEVDKALIELDNRRMGLPLLVEGEEEYFTVRDGINEFIQTKKRLQEKKEWLHLIDEEMPKGGSIPIDPSILKEEESIKIELSRLSERQQLVFEGIRHLAEIEKELHEKEQRLEEHVREKQATEKAKVVLEELCSRMNEDYQVLLKEKLSTKLGLLTDGKYRNIKVDEELNLRVFDEEEDKIVEVERLSSGTKDLMYLALRLSMMEILSIKAPLILDDSFIQFDEQRLNAMLKLLNKLSQEYQIILFTCHNREREILKNLNISFNYITL